MSIKEGLANSKIGRFWLKYNEKIILAVGIILIAAVSFEAGFLQGQKNKQGPVVVNKVASDNISKCEEQSTKITGDSKTLPTAQATKQSSNQPAGQPAIEPQTCAFVASKNSDKYHLATCQWAQKIKPENKICFSSADEAQKRGYMGAKCCIK